MAVSNPANDNWLTRVYDEMGGAVFGYLRSLLHDTHRAEDVMQNVFLRLASAQQQNIHNLRAFVFTVAHNEAVREIDRWRAHKQHCRGIGEAIFEVAAGATLDVAEAASLEEALLILPVEQREIVYLKIYAGMTFDEIAHTLSLSQNTVASRYRYALEKMRQRLSDAKE